MQKISEYINKRAKIDKLVVLRFKNFYSHSKDSGGKIYRSLDMKSTFHSTFEVDFGRNFLVNNFFHIIKPVPWSFLRGISRNIYDVFITMTSDHKVSS